MENIQIKAKEKDISQIPIVYALFSLKKILHIVA